MMTEFSFGVNSPSRFSNPLFTKTLSRFTRFFKPAFPLKKSLMCFFRIVHLKPFWIIIVLWNVQYRDILLTILFNTINIDVPLRAEVTLSIWKANLPLSAPQGHTFAPRTSRELWPLWSFYRLLLTFTPKNISPRSPFGFNHKKPDSEHRRDVLRDVGCFIVLRM